MKAVGAIVIIITAYVLGRARRENMMRAEKILRQMIQLCKEIKSAIAYSAGSMVTVFETCAHKESYDQLGFLGAVAHSENDAQNLGRALCDGLDDWEHASVVSKDEIAVFKNLFQEIGSESAQSETAKLNFAQERLEAALANRRDVNEKRKGYYETLFTLTGIAIAILII